MRAKEEAIAALRSFATEDEPSYEPGQPRASVLVPLFVKDGQLHTLMTLRSAELRSNAGEVCFPGGKRDAGDRDDVDTALREAHEEVGLVPDSVEVVCRLTPVPGRGSMKVTPVVGFIPESFSPRPNTSEVSAVFSVPLDFFIKAKDHTIRGLKFPEFQHSFDFLDPDSGREFSIWGLTAIIAIIVAMLALEKDPEFELVSDLDKKSFLQRNLHGRLSKL